MKKCRRSPASQVGLSLLEVLVSLAVVFLVLLGFAGFAKVANTGIKASEKMTRAVTLAQEKMEDVRRQGIPAILTASINEIEPYGSIPSAPFHKRTLRIEPHTPMPGLHSVTVNVQWDNDAHRTTVHTYLLN
ncbi:MAG: hypothetical protein R3351_10160 [Nitrospirales bacterium]|nr:hypothetical protein [Nitrospirales bacterium]